ncbi:hypothetical protein NRIC_33980 [Enterococcus florum]|uniref:Uncharacterized protein n=1 Tax=Enterococcus florum TaxID=2480627 RepID=A0A4P5PBH3_9ENTE|nr:hypothetical protein [Enterococcus florum]GCF95507.1 hypothetical protein NRIC_33980 [Enterococcus florum]
MINIVWVLIRAALIVNLIYGVYKLNSNKREVVAYEKDVLIKLILIMVGFTIIGILTQVGMHFQLLSSTSPLPKTWLTILESIGFYHVFAQVWKKSEVIQHGK